MGEDAEGRPLYSWPESFPRGDGCKVHKPTRAMFLVFVYDFLSETCRASFDSLLPL